VKLTALARCVCRRFRSPRNGLLRRRPGAGRTPSYRPRLERLEDRAVPAGLLRLATLGDSLTAPYPPTAAYGAAGDRSWAEQLQLLHPDKVDITNVAVPGATSADVLADQAPLVADLVAHHRVDYASVIVGANDVAADLPVLVSSGPQAFVQTFVTDVVGNVARTVAEVRAAGDVGVVVGDVPDVTTTPAFQVFVSQTFGAAVPQVLQATVVTVTQANERLEALAEAGHIPVVDLFGLSRRITTPFTVGRVSITNPYAPDFFHPNRVAQGVLGNTVLEALHEGYRVPLRPLRLSDQEILAEAGLVPAYNRPRTYFDVRPFVLFQRHSHGDFDGDFQGDCHGATVAVA
jgi:lysophospholipase L1-like esterase